MGLGYTTLKLEFSFFVQLNFCTKMLHTQNKEKHTALKRSAEDQSVIRFPLFEAILETQFLLVYVEYAPRM